MRNTVLFHRSLPAFMVFVVICCFFSGVVDSEEIKEEIKHEQLKDGVEHWYREAPADGRSRFFRQMANLFDVILPNREKLPFGKSVALLVGVSQYEHIQPKELRFVKNDLEDMRNFLLGKGGFDEVYIASEGIVNRDLIEKYMKKELRKKLQPEDRLLFYYAGHGADAEGGKTGYMQFSEAEPDYFGGAQVLAINDANDWSRELKMNHLLFFFDCCASGLAFVERGGVEAFSNQVLAALSKNGSRIAFTAGTGGEKTFEVEGQDGKGNGVFTRAFLNAVEAGKADLDLDGFITTDEIIARIKTEIAGFEARYNRRISPRQWELVPETYGGTFIFLNPETKTRKIPLKEEYANEIGAERGGVHDRVYGGIEIIAYLPEDVSGDVYLDQKQVGRIESGVGLPRDLSPGSHTIEIRIENQGIAKKDVNVVKGKFQSVRFRPDDFSTPAPTVTPVPTAPKKTPPTMIWNNANWDQGIWQ